MNTIKRSFLTLDSCLSSIHFNQIIGLCVCMFLRTQLSWVNLPMYLFIMLTVELRSTLMCLTLIDQTVINEFTAFELVVTK
jgi:hypothetical protein